MAVKRDLSLARGLAVRALKSRRQRRRLERLGDTGREPAPGSVRVAVYFADTTVNMYQIRQWYAPLAHLAQTVPGAGRRRSSPRRSSCRR